MSYSRVAAHQLARNSLVNYDVGLEPAQSRYYPLTNQAFSQSVWPTGLHHAWLQKRATARSCREQ